MYMMVVAAAESSVACGFRLVEVGDRVVAFGLDHLWGMVLVMVGTGFEGGCYCYC